MANILVNSVLIQFKHPGLRALMCAGASVAKRKMRCTYDCKQRELHTAVSGEPPLSAAQASKVHQVSGLQSFLACLYCTEKRKTRNCWKCNRVTDRVKEMFFCAPCDIIQAPDPTANYFEVLGIEESFKVDTEALSQRYRFLQTKLHPDKFVIKSEIEKEFSVLQSTIVNKAYSRLLNPLKRGLYLLELNGQPVKDGEVQIDQDFLLGVMDTNEKLIAVDNINDLQEIDKINSAKLAELEQLVKKAFEDSDIEQARALLAHMKYFDNINEKIKKIKQERFGVI